MLAGHNIRNCLLSSVSIELCTCWLLLLPDTGSLFVRKNIQFSITREKPLATWKTTVSLRASTAAGRNNVRKAKLVFLEVINQTLFRKSNIYTKYYNRKNEGNINDDSLAVIRIFSIPPRYGGYSAVRRGEDLGAPGPRRGKWLKNPENACNIRNTPGNKGKGKEARHSISGGKEGDGVKSSLRNVEKHRE